MGYLWGILKIYWIPSNFFIIFPLFKKRIVLNQDEILFLEIGFGSIFWFWRWDLGQVGVKF